MEIGGVMDRLTIHQDLRGRDGEFILAVFNVAVETAWQAAGYSKDYSLSTIEVPDPSYEYIERTMITRWSSSTVVEYLKRNGLAAMLGWKTKVVSETAALRAENERLKEEISAIRGGRESVGC